MLHSALYPGTSRIAGSGLVALRDIPMGTAVWGPCPRCRVWPASEWRTTPQAVMEWLDEFGYRLADGSLIAPCESAHLMNHSCDAAVLDFGLSVGITVRDIRRSEEVTCDYHTFRYDGPWSFHCRCGSPGCQRVVRAPGTDLPTHLVTTWQRRMRPALEASVGVSQELEILPGSVVDIPIPTGSHAT